MHWLILCTGFDLRGFGQSIKTEADRGSAGPTALTLADLASFIEVQLDSEPKDIPVFVMRHSMGGQLIATIASVPEYKQLMSRLAGIMIYAPYIKVSDVSLVTRMKLFAARWARMLLPCYRMVFFVAVDQF